MKNLSILILLIVFSLGAGTVYGTDLAVNNINLKGNSNTSLGKFEIKELIAADLNGETMRTFELSYEKGQKTVLIYLEERANCRDYLVRSKNLEVAYKCKKNSFGVQLIPVKHQKYKPELNARFLVQDEFAKQEKISEGELPIESALGTIASYYPNLLINLDLLN